MPAADLQQFLGAIESLLRIDHGGISHDHVRFLQIVVDREQQIAFLDVIAFANFQRFDTALLVGRDENQLGLDPALQNAVVAVVTACERERRENERQTGESSCSWHSPLREQQVEMCLHHLANVERLETFEQAVPDDGDETRRGNDLRKVREPFRHFAARSRARAAAPARPQ